MTVSAKRVRVSDDGGSTYYTLPGATGSFSNDAGQIKDTIFGQPYESNTAGLINWSLSAQAFYKGFAGYVATIKKPGTATTFSSEATTLVSTRIYQITNAAKRVLDRTTAIVIKDGATDVTAQVEYYDYLAGIVKFVNTYTVVGSVTFFSGKYLPMATIGKAKSFTLGMTANAVENTTFDVAQGNSGRKTFQSGLKMVSCDLSGIYDLAANAWAAMLTSRSEVVIEINPDGGGASIARGFFRAVKEGQSGDVGALEEETISFKLNVPDDALMLTPFNWYHTATTLSVAVQKCITAFLNGTALTVAYLWDGTNGFKGSAVITDLSLSGGLEAMNTFTTNFQGSDTLTALP